MTAVRVVLAAAALLFPWGLAGALVAAAAWRLWHRCALCRGAGYLRTAAPGLTVLCPSCRGAGR